MCILPLYLMPRSLKRVASFLLACLWFYVLRIRRTMTEKQVDAVFEGISPSDRSKIVFQSYYNLLMILFEYSYFPFGSRAIRKHSTIKNLNKLDEALAEGKGVFLLAGHLGNGEMALFRTCLEGYPLRLIAKRVGVPFIDKTLFEIREVCGLVHIPPKLGGEMILESVKDNAPVVFVMDQFSHPPKGVATTFLGIPTYTNSSLAHFAIKTDAIVLPVNVYRGKKDISVIEFQDRIQTELPYPTQEQNIRHMTQKYNDWLDQSVRQNVGDWMWVHRRWKRKPERSVLEI